MERFMKLSILRNGRSLAIVSLCLVIYGAGFLAQSLHSSSVALASAAAGAADALSAHRDFESVLDPLGAYEDHFPPAPPPDASTLPPAQRIKALEGRNQSLREELKRVNEIRDLQSKQMQALTDALKVVGASAKSSGPNWFELVAGVCSLIAGVFSMFLAWRSDRRENVELRVKIAELQLSARKGVV